MFVHLYRLLSVYSLIGVSKRRHGGEADIGLVSKFPSQVSKPGSKRSAAVASAADCLNLHNIQSESTDPADIPDVFLYCTSQ
jgi:hypothetical protein